MNFLYLLENLRFPLMDTLMLNITSLGDEFAFLVVALILFWCVDKRQGYYVLSIGFIGTIINQFMKLWFRIPRPWVLDENFTILEQAREAASGYSFPSGHTQSAVGTFGAVAYTTKDKLIRSFCIAVAVLVPFSRMYIGVHTPADVLTAAIIALILVFALRPVVFHENKKYFSGLIAFMVVLSVGYLLFVKCYPFPGNVDVSNLVSGTQNAFTFVGAVFGMVIVYIVDNKWLNFQTKAVWWAQLVKVFGGLILVLAVKSGTKEVLNLLMGENVGRAVRYFLVVIIAGIVWPLTFRLFPKPETRE